MLKLTKTGIGLLTRQYRSVLHKCFLINVGLFALGAASVMVPSEAGAEVIAPTPTLDDLSTKAASFTPSQQYTLETTQGSNTNFLFLDDGSGTLTQYWYTGRDNKYNGLCFHRRHKILHI